MSSSEQRPPLLVLVGPTAVGKTALSLTLAEELNAEIISADSRLFYRGMDIGTAKPTPAMRAQVKHHLIDVSAPDEEWSLSRFQAAVAAAVADICGRGRVPLMAGGTGQFVRAVVAGWQPPSLSERPELRAELERQGRAIGASALHQRLNQLDPAAAEKIEPRNLRRTVRALEVILTTGRLFSTQRTSDTPAYRTLQLGLTRPRDELYRRIDARIDEMFAAGLVDEVRALLESYPADLRSFSAIGYRQVIDHLAGKLSLAETQQEIRRATRVFARRQANWFKPDDPEITWVDAAAGSLEQLLGKARQHLEKT